MKHKTNRQWLAEHPEKINGGEIAKVLKRAAGNEKRLDGMTLIEALDEWLDAPRIDYSKEPEGNTAIFTIEVVKTFRGESPLPSVLEKEAHRITENIRKSGTDGARIAKIQVLVREK